jgi:hypothetical protein
MSFCIVASAVYYYVFSITETVRTTWRGPGPKLDFRAKKLVVQADVTGVMVFLHIQKTGGTEFGRHLLFLDVGKPCLIPGAIGGDSPRTAGRKVKLGRGSKCYRPGQHNLSSKETWLFSRYTIGWPCGVHADWTELHECVEKTLEDREGPKEREFFYVTMLREPVARFISEFAHVKRGATWVTKHHCNGREVSKEDIPHCYPGYSKKEAWPNVTLHSFMGCKSNLGINRQTRMLADMRLVDCYKKTYKEEERGRRMLESAMMNLRSMSYLGLSEYQIESRDLFEYMFGMRFTDEFAIRQDDELRSEREMDLLSESDIQRIKEVNYLDMKLYDYAKKIFFERINKMKMNSSLLRNSWQRYFLVDNK